MFSNLASKLKYYLAAAFGILLLLLGREAKEKQEAEAKLETANADKTDAVLATKQADAASANAAKVEQLTEEKAKSLSPDEMTDYLKKNL